MKYQASVLSPFLFVVVVDVTELVSDMQYVG